MNAKRKTRSAVHARSSGSVKIISLDIASVRARLAEAARRLRSEDSDVLSVWLFGSLARGDYLPGSDADLLIILAKSELPFHSRIDRFAEWFSDVGIGVDLLAVTASELEERAEDPFWGKILVERERLA